MFYLSDNIILLIIHIQCAKFFSISKKKKKDTYFFLSEKIYQYISRNIFLIFISSGQKSKQRFATAITSPTSRDRPGDDAPVRGSGVFDLQHFTLSFERARNVYRGSAALDGAIWQLAGDHQQQHQFHHLRDLRAKIQEDIP